MEHLSTEEKKALTSLVSITNVAAPKGVALLRESGWSVESAIARFYDSEETAEDEAQFEIDDSATARQPGSFAFYFRHIFARVAFPFQLIFATPLRLVYGLLGFLARTLRIQPLLIRPRNPFTREPARSPTSAAEQWIRSLEEATSSVRYSRRNESATSTATASTSGLVHRGASAEQRVVPDFIVSSYTAALQRAKSETRVLMVILTCEEHQSDAEFKSVLADSELVRTLNAEGILAWGGDVRERDAYQAAKTLQYFSLPFIAFISLQPRSATSTASPRMTVISRLEGSPATTTSAAAIVSHITTIVVPRVSPFLRRLRSEEANRASERAARLEAERSLARAAKDDTERVLKRRADEFERKEADRLARQKEDESASKARRIASLKKSAEEWRSWARATILRDEPMESEESIRIAVVLGNGRKAARRFRLDDPVSKIYAFVECELDPPSTATDSPSPPPADIALPSPPADYEHIFEFQLATTYPRILLQSEGTLRDLLPDDGDVSLVVEGLAARRASQGDEASDEEEY